MIFLQPQKGGMTRKGGNAVADLFSNAHRCRRYINRKYRLRLEPRDCYYWQYPAHCDDCGEVRNIVTGIRPLSKWKLWFKKLED